MLPETLNQPRLLGREIHGERDCRLTKKLTHSRVSASIEIEGNKRKTSRSKTATLTAVACSDLARP
jgi:hypothetical protein